MTSSTTPEGSNKFASRVRESTALAEAAALGYKQKINQLYRGSRYPLDPANNDSNTTQRRWDTVVDHMEERGQIVADHLRQTMAALADEYGDPTIKHMLDLAEDGAVIHLARYHVQPGDQNCILNANGGGDRRVALMMADRLAYDVARQKLRENVLKISPLQTHVPSWSLIAHPWLVHLYSNGTLGLKSDVFPVDSARLIIHGDSILPNDPSLHFSIGVDGAAILTVDAPGFRPQALEIAAKAPGMRLVDLVSANNDRMNIADALSTILISCANVHERGVPLKGSDAETRAKRRRLDEIEAEDAFQREMTAELAKALEQKRKPKEIANVTQRLGGVRLKHEGHSIRLTLQPTTWMRLCAPSVGFARSTFLQMPISKR